MSISIMDYFLIDTFGFFHFYSEKIPWLFHTTYSMCITHSFTQLYTLYAILNIRLIPFFIALKDTMI
jgi:hypothetical protein